MRIVKFNEDGKHYATKVSKEFYIKYKNAHFESGIIKNSAHPENKIYFAQKNKGVKEFDIWIELTIDEALGIANCLIGACWGYLIKKEVKKEAKNLISK